MTTFWFVWGMSVGALAGVWIAERYGDQYSGACDRLLQAWDNCGEVRREWHDDEPRMVRVIDSASWTGLNHE